MIELYTSRWKNKELVRLDCQPVSVSRGDGRGVRFSYRKLWDLTPSKATFAMSDADAARVSYREGLEQIGAERIRDQLQELADAAGAPLVLLCHENVMEGQGCHRRWFADWWLEQNGIEIPELQPGDLADAAEVQQPRLL
jgi:hypothetical protein